jgi:hypothetical protein
MNNIEVLILLAVGVLLISIVGQFGTSDHKELTPKSKKNKKRVKKTAPKVAKQEVVKKAVIEPVSTESSKTDFKRSVEKKNQVTTRFRELAYSCPGCAKKVVATYIGSKLPEASECFECAHKVKTYDADEAKVKKTNNVHNTFQKPVAKNEKREEVQVTRGKEDDDLAKLRLILKENNTSSLWDNPIAENEKSEEAQVAKVEESDDLAKLRLKVRMSQLKNKTRLI